MFESKISPEDFASWLVKASTGDRIVYGSGGYMPAEKPKIARTVYRAYTAKQVLLAQEKIAASTYNYIAIRATTNLLNERMRAGK